jgi:hypothetical protein
VYLEIDAQANQSKLLLYCKKMYHNFRYLWFSNVDSDSFIIFILPACLILFIFDSFGASQAIYRNLWYIESPLWKEICLFSSSQKINILTAQYKRISNEQAVRWNSDNIRYLLWYEPISFDWCCSVTKKWINSEFENEKKDIIHQKSKSS